MIKFDRYNYLTTRPELEFKHIFCVFLPILATYCPFVTPDGSTQPKH